MRDEGTKVQDNISATRNGFAEFKSSEPTDESAATPVGANVTGTYFRETSLEAISLPPAIMALQAKLKTAYTQNSGLKLLLDERREFSLRDLFVDLELITTSIKQKKEPEKDVDVDRKQDGERDPTLRREFYKVLEEQRKSIEPEQLFSTLDDNPAPSRVWLEGAAGTGKTTLCRYLAYHWATAEVDKAFWPQFKVVIYLPLREIVDRYDNTQEYDLSAVVLGPWHKLTSFGKDAFGRPLINEADKTALWEFIQAYPQAVVFLLDGFDEVHEPHPAVQALVNYAPCYLLSSRPHLAPTGIQREVETRGFSPKHIRQYVERYFKLIEADEAESKGLLAWLDRNPHLLGLSQVPLNCQMICAAWHSKALPEQPTLTQLYETLMAQWQRRALWRLGKIPEHVLNEYSAKDVNIACHSWMQILHELAFRTLQAEASVLISGAWLEEAIEQSLTRQGKIITADEKQNLAKEVLNLGIIVRQNHHARLFSDRYEVIHLTFMEYLVADYLAEGLNQEPGSPAFLAAKNSVERYQDAERFNIVWWFMAGRLITQAPNRLNLFFRLLVKGAAQDPFGFDPSLQLIRCAEEAGLYSVTRAECSSIPTAFKEHLLKLAATWFRLLGLFDTSCGLVVRARSRRFVQMLSMSPNFSQPLASREFNGFADYLHTENICMLGKETFIWIIQYCSKAEIQACFFCLKESLAHEDDDVRASAFEIFKALVPRLSTEQVMEVWPELKELLAHEEDHIRYSTHRFFKTLVPKLSAEQVTEVWSKIKESLVDEADPIRYLALRLFAALVPSLSDKQAMEVWPWIKESLVHEEEHIRYAALQLFTALVPSLSAEQVKEVWSEFKKSLAHEDHDVRASAFELFKALVSRLSAEQVMEVWPGLKKSLVHEDFFVHISALQPLEAFVLNLSAEQVTEIWSEIKESLAHEDDDVRASAFELFEAFVPRLSAEQVMEVWFELKESLAHAEDHIHYLALRLLKALVPTLSIKQIMEIWSGLKESLAHAEGHIHYSALGLLEALVPTLSIKQIMEIWSGLKESLAHEDDNHLWALQIFKALVPKLPAEQVMEAWPWIKKTLAHEDSDVRASALELFKALVLKSSAEQCMEIWSEIKELLADEVIHVHSSAHRLFEVLMPKLTGFIESDWELILTVYIDIDYPFTVSSWSLAQLLNHLSPQAVLACIGWLQVSYERSMSDLAQLATFTMKLDDTVLPAFLNYLKTCPPNYKDRIQNALQSLFKPIRPPEHEPLCYQLLSDLSSSDLGINQQEAHCVFDVGRDEILRPFAKPLVANQHPHVCVSSEDQPLKLNPASITFVKRRRNSMSRSTEIMPVSATESRLAMVELSSLPLRMMELSHLAESAAGPSLVHEMMGDGDRAAAHISQLIARHDLRALHYQDGEGNTLLHYAVLCGHMSLVEQLAEYHLSTPNALGLQAMHLAVLCGQTALVQYLLENGAPQTPISVVYTHPMTQENWVIDCTPLQLAVVVGQVEIAESLLADDRCRAQIQLSMVGGHLLHLAVLANQTQVLVRLLNNPVLKIRINEADVKGRTPLSLAAYVNDAKAISLLCQAGADKHAISALGRTPLHEAVEGRALEALEVLISEFVDLSLEDESGNKARNVAQHYKAEQTAHTDQFFIFQTMESRLRHAELARRSAEGRPPQVRQLFSRYKNLIFQGGGAKGIAYVGALQELARLKLLPQIQRVGGTSAGAITATLLAVGYTPDELLLKLREKNLGDFLEGVSFESGALGLCKEVLTEGYRQLYARSGLSWSSAWQALKPWHVAHSVTGLIEAKDFLAWIEALIKEKTGIDHCTFGELSAKAGVGGSCRHLHLVASRLGEGQKIEVFSSEDEQWKDLVISEAVRASMSIPAVFKPYSPRWKSIDGRLYSKTLIGGQATLYADGGLLMNYPIELFDRQKYQRSYLTEAANRELVIINNETLGFSLKYEPAGVVKVDDITTMTEAAKALLNFYYDAETLMGQLLQRGQHRTITIDPKGISTLEFSLSAAQQALLMESGQEATAQFFAPTGDLGSRPRTSGVGTHAALFAERGLATSFNPASAARIEEDNTDTAFRTGAAALPKS